MAHYVLFSALYLPHLGGVESFTAHVGAELRRRGHRVTVVTSRIDDSPSSETQGDGVEVVRLDCRPLMGGRFPLPRRTGAYREALGRLEDEGIDRMLVNTRFYPHSVEGLALASRCGAPAVVLDHGSAYLSLGNPLGDAALRVWEHALTAAGRRYHPSYAGVSRASAQWLSTFHVTCEHLIPDAIDAPAFRTRRSSRDFRAELGLGADTYLISFVGRLEPIKGGLSLARALTLLPKDYACVIAGEGSEYQPIAELGCNRVHLVGNLSPADVSALHASSDVFCLPSRSEGFCLAYLEASAWGLPSVMPDVGVVSEVMGAGDFGRIVTDCEPTTLAMALREVAERFDHRHLSDLIDLIERRYSWEASATAVEACFGDASSAD